MQKRKPATIVTGFLGAGKTSMINHLIRSKQKNCRFAVIVNEFGALGIDGDLVAQSNDDVIELRNGCLCCEVRSDLIAACERLLERRDQFDSLIIETSGVADPAPIAQSFLISDGPGLHYALAGIVTLVDAVHGAGQLANSQVALSQVAMADRIILTKADLALPAEVVTLSERLRGLNNQAEVIVSSQDRIASDALFQLEAYSFDSLPARLRGAPITQHDSSVASLSFAFIRSFDFSLFSAFIRQLMLEKGKDLLRVKGLMSIAGEDRKFVFHGVQTLVDGDVIGPWGDELRESRVVFIGRGLQRHSLEERLRACLV